MTEKNRNNIVAMLKGKSLSEAKKLLCGKFLGCGTFRCVYVLKQNPSYVVKIEKDVSMAYFANVMEWRNYIDNREWKFLDNWLAPCEMINETGTILIQKRVKHGKEEDYPKKYLGVLRI